MLPSALTAFGPQLGNELSVPLTAFTYLGSNGFPYGILAIERPVLRHNLQRHWTDDRLAVLHTDFSVSFVRTNELPIAVLDAAQNGE
jgi:hypothetical protein